MHERTRYYNNLEGNIREEKQHVRLFLLGDFNARLHGRREGEEQVLGKHIFGKGIEYAEKRREDKQVLNRDLLMELSIPNGLVVLNTLFQKADRKLTTFRIPGTKDLSEVNADKFATTDHIICRRKHKDMVRNVEANTTVAFPSDHFPLLAEIKIKINKAKPQYKGGKIYENPTHEEKERFNRIFSNCQAVMATLKTRHTNATRQLNTHSAHCS